MTSRERVECAIAFQEPDRVPFNFWMDRRRMAELDAQFGHDFRIRRFGADVIESYSVAPPFPSAEMEERSGTHWIVKEAFDDWSEAENLQMPDPNAPGLYEGLEAHLREFPDKAIIVNSPSVLTIIESMRKHERLYVDLCMHPEAVKAFFEQISDVMRVCAENVCKLDITALYVQDDAAFNDGPLMSEEMLREFVVPHWKKIIDVAHEHSKPVFFHSDGKVTPIAHIFAELGVCMVNPMQPELQDIAAFKGAYHGRVGIYGGLQTGALHTWEPDEIRQHVFDTFEKAGEGGGLILSTHDIDYAITLEQVEAMVDAIKECTY